MSAAAGSSRGPFAKGMRRREEILDRALEVFDQVGFKATSLRAIAQAIGVTHAALRHYFGTTDELLLAVLRRADDRALDGFDVSGLSTANEFSAAMAEGTMHVPGLTALYATMTAQALGSADAPSRAFFAERYDRMRRFARLVLENSRTSGAVRGDVSLDVAAALLIAASDGLTTQWLIDPSINIAEGLRLLDRLLLPEPR